MLEARAWKDVEVVEADALDPATLNDPGLRLPEIGDGEDVAALCKTRFGARIGAMKVLSTVAHGFTHFHLDIEPLRVTVQKVEARAASPGAMWLSLEDAQGAALPAPVRRILAGLDG